MNIKYLQECIEGFSEFKILGKTMKKDEAICHIMGFVRCEGQMKLMALEYDADFVQRCEDAEINEINGLTERRNTNRDHLRNDHRISPAGFLESVSKVSLGDIELEVKGSEKSRCNMQDWKVAVILTGFLRNGWDPEGIDYQHIDNLFLSILEFDGDFPSIPDFGDSQVLKLVFRSESISYPAEQPFLFKIEADYRDKLWFVNKEGGERHWMQINRVYLYDIWTEMEKVFDAPQLKEQITPEEIMKRKEEFDAKLSEICPKGMLFPLIEYECEDNITLQFYSRPWLDREPFHRGSSVGFIVRPDEKTGILGLPLKACIIQEPMALETDIIEVELFSFSVLHKADDVTIK